MTAMIEAADGETGSRKMLHQRLVSPAVLAYPMHERDNRPCVFPGFPALGVELETTGSIEARLGHSRHKHPN